MKGNSFGRIFRVTTWGESHGPAGGAIVDGCPAGIAIDADLFRSDMQMRQGGHGSHSTPRQESDLVQVESGVFEGKSTGAPIALRIENQNIQSKDYERFRHVPRPGHADITTHWKHDGVRDHRGGGRSSARETAARVAAGSIAKEILRREGIDVLAFVRRIGSAALSFSDLPFHQASKKAIEGELWERVGRERMENPWRVPTKSPEIFSQAVERAVLEKDSLGGTVECWVKGLPRGLGEPVFEKLSAQIASALMSLPAAVVVESGGGYAMSQAPGSEIRDSIGSDGVEGNRHGGLLGGMTTGEPLWCAVHFHAPTSIPRSIASVDLRDGSAQALKVEGRHDSVPLPRAVPMVEAMISCVLVDALLIARAKL